MKHLRRTHWFWALVEPKSANDDLRRREFILNVLLVSSTVLSIAALLIVVIRSVSLGHQYSGESPVLAMLPLVLFAGLWVLSRKGFFIPAAYVLVTILSLLAAYTLFTWGIGLPQGLLLLALVLTMSSVLLGTAFGAVITLLAAVILILLSWLQQTGRLSFDSSWMKTPSGPADAIGFALTLGIITTVSWLSNREIDRFNVTLQERVREATERLQAANKKLKVLDHAKDEFISMASHQLGTPLTAIVGFLSMALDNDEGNMKPDQKQFARYALEAAESMGAMSRELLNVSRISSGRFKFQPQATDLTRLVEHELEQLRPAAERKGLKLTFIRPAPPLGDLSIDESKTRQVVMNFIDNAIYYTAKGGVQVELRQDNGNVVFAVTDTGIGVPASEQSKLFAKFYRAANAKKARPDGTGLGLYLAKQVIEGQNGRIIFTSKEGHGSTFGFSLPFASHPMTQKAPPKRVSI